jgi:hypothetical protein
VKTLSAKPSRSFATPRVGLHRHRFFDPEMERIEILRSVCAALDDLEPLVSQARRLGWRHDEEEKDGA